MFSTAKKKTNASHQARELDSPVTPLRSSFNDAPVPNRPSTGTPAPWPPRLSVLARVPQVNSGNGKGDSIKPVFVAEFPQAVCDEQLKLLHKRVPVEDRACGGIDKSTSLAWIICGNRIFLWSYLSPSSSAKCVVLEIPLDDIEFGKNDAPSWLLCIVNCNSATLGTNKVAKQCTSAAVVLCNRQTRAVVYWPDIYSQLHNGPVTSLASSDELETISTPDGKTPFNRQPRQSKQGTSLNGVLSFNSLIASAIPGRKLECVALSCSSNGELWQFQCTPSGIHRRKVHENNMHFPIQQGDSGQTMSNKGYPRSLTWCFLKESSQQFLLLTDNEIQCFRVEFGSDICVSKLWSHEFVETDAEAGIKKGLAGQKRNWPLDVQVDDNGKVITVLVATFCKDRISSSSYMQCSLLTLQYKSGLGEETTNDGILEKKTPVEVVIPKARVEDEVEDKDFLFSMRLRVGGKPSGSTIIISGDGTATVSHYYWNSTRLYQFDLPYDAGKVLDASILPSADDYKEGAWVVLTEKAGIWTIPEKAVILGGVKPRQWSLSRKGSTNVRSANPGYHYFAGNFRSVNSHAWIPREALSGIARQTGQDEESEALLNNLFNEFLSSGQVDRPLEKLETSGSFERDGETNVFARVSKSIIDTLPKHWTTTRGAEILAMAVVSAQLLEKQQKHQKFLHFLALSKMP